MTRASIAELVESWRPRYLKASREEKTLILNEFVALTGYQRKFAIRLLHDGRKQSTSCAEEGYGYIPRR